MGAVLEVARVAAGLNVLVCLALCSVWLRNYRRFGADHTLAMLAFGCFLLAENVLWLYLYVLSGDYVAWFHATTLTVQVAVAGLCVLELVALGFVGWITWR